MNFRQPAPAPLVAAVLGLLLGSGPLAGSAAAAAPSSGSAPTASVVLERSGGLAGGTDVFAADQSISDQRAARLMELTSGHRFRSLDAEYLPQVTCCDRYHYRIVVGYADGGSKTVSTVDEAPSAPCVLREVIDLTMLVGTRVEG